MSRKFTIDEIEIIELDWPDYTHEESWKDMYAYYMPDVDAWFATNRDWWKE